jgi:translocation and assembly module TamB
VDLRKLELALPASLIEAHGQLGAYPLSSPTAMNIDFKSHNLGEFDTTLRALGLEHNGKSGAAALPLSLQGEGEFHGVWGGSMMSPRLQGNLKATEVALELPPNPHDQARAPQFVRWDAIEANGSYDAERIAIVHGRLNRGLEQILLDGTLAAANAGTAGANRGQELPAYDANSLLRAHVRATRVAVGDLFPLVGIQEPVTGTLEADFEAEGTLGELGGTGWVELDDGTAYGEPVTRMRAQGTLANETLKLSSVTIANQAGSVAGSGSIDLRSRRFQAEARAAGLDVANIERMHRAGENVSGKLGFTATASGTIDEPRVEAHATISGLAID